MEIFVARQPVFDRHGQVYGYELLYRSGNQNFSAINDPDRASMEVIRNSFTVIGIDTLAGGRKALINFTQNLLTSDLITILPHEQVVIEILENVPPTPEVLQACRHLKEKGYRLALDDFVWKEELQAFIGLADLIKVDLLQTGERERAALLRRIGTDRVEFLAEKVETQADYHSALNQGFKYFQGYYFCKPSIISGRDIPEPKLAYLRLVQELYRPEFGFDQLEQVVKNDLSLSYKLLRLINSAAFGLRFQVNSIKHALVLMGLEEIKKWVALIAMRAIGEDKPSELVVVSLIRANLCEALAPKVGLTGRSSDLFLLGMFSTIDVLLNRPMVEILDEIALASEVRQALLGENNQLRRILNLTLFYEKGEWEQFKLQCEGLGVNESEVVQFYLSSLRMVQKIIE